jgi:hypothetical protein
MKRRYYLSYRSDNFSDNFMAVMIFTTKCGAHNFTEARRKAETTTYIIWDMYDRLMTRQEAIGRSSNGKIYTDWRVAARERIPGFNND